MKASILPTSHTNSHHIHMKYADITRYFLKMGLWEHRSIYSCARDTNSRIASEKFSRAWIYGFILPLSQNSIKSMGFRELTTLASFKRGGSLGGSHV